MADLQFLEARLDPKITQGASGGPFVAGRLKRYSPSGRLTQNFVASMPLHRYDVSHGVRSREDFQSVLSSFYVVMFTPYSGLRFKDWADFRGTPTNTSLRSLGGGGYQLRRNYTFGGTTVYRDIIKPVSGTVTLYDAGGAALTATVDTTTGIATAVSGTPAYWTGHFDVPVTFVDDEWTASNEIANEATGWLTSAAIKLEEIRL